MPAKYTRGVLTFDEALIARLKLAAEEVAWLTGRGYPLDAVGDLVAGFHALSAPQRAALALGTCSEPQYRRRAARELEAEDVARRPLSIDIVDALRTIEAALRGEAILQTLDGTVRAVPGGDGPRSSYTVTGESEPAVDLLLKTARELKPSLLRFFVSEADASAELVALLDARAKLHKAKMEMVTVPAVDRALRKERQVVTGDAETLDACAAWFNLVGRVVAQLAAANVVRLQ